MVPAPQLVDPKCCVYDMMVSSFSSTTIKRVAEQPCKWRLMLSRMPKRQAAEFEPVWPNYMGGTRAVPHVMLYDCRSLVANLNAEVPSWVQDKRASGHKPTRGKAVCQPIGLASDVCRAKPSHGFELEGLPPRPVQFCGYRYGRGR